MGAHVTGPDSDLGDRIRTIVAEQLGVDVDEVSPDSSILDDLGADSLDLVELIMSLEEEFSSGEEKFEIPDEAAEKIITLQDAIDYIKEQGVGDD